MAAENGEIDGAESGFAWGGTMPSPSTFTANITLYPKVNAMVANEDAFGRLSDEHREILREAAAKAVRYVVQNAPTEADRAAVYCRNGGAIAFAAEADVAALERAAQPVYDGARGRPADQGAHRADQGDEGAGDQLRPMRSPRVRTGEQRRRRPPRTQSPRSSRRASTAPIFRRST